LFSFPLNFSKRFFAQGLQVSSIGSWSGCFLPFPLLFLLILRAFGLTSSFCDVSYLALSSAPAPTFIFLPIFLFSFEASYPFSGVGLFYLQPVQSQPPTLWRSFCILLFPLLSIFLSPEDIIFRPVNSLFLLDGKGLSQAKKARFPKSTVIAKLLPFFFSPSS